MQMVQPKTKTNLEEVDLRLAVCDEPPVGDLPVRLSCRAHPDANPSLCVYTDHIHCYSIGCSVQIYKRLEALAYLLGLYSWRDALRVAYKYTNEGLEAYRVKAEAKARKDPYPKSMAQLYYNGMHQTRTVRGRAYRPVSWYIERGLTPETIEQFLLGHDGQRFTIPVFGSKGELLNIRFRKDETYCTEEDYTSDGNCADGSSPNNRRLLKKYSGVPGRNGTYLYPEWIIKQDTRDWIVIVEGELDAARLHQAGYPVATSTNGAGNLRSCLTSLSVESRIKHILIATDQDEPGEYAANELRMLALEHGYTARRVSWPREWGKDVTELYLNGHTLKQAMNAARTGL